MDSQFIPYQLELFDIMLMPLFLVLIYFIGSRARARYAGNEVLYRYFGQAMWVKVFCAMAFCLVYMYYYNGGDTMAYYHWANQWSKYLFSNPVGAIEFIIEDDRMIFWNFVYNSNWNNCLYIMKYGSSEVFFVKIVSIVNLIGANSMLCTSMLFGYFSFLGIWRLYLVFYDMYPKLHKSLARVILFIPSVVFWGSGIMKDTLTLTCLCWLVYCLYFGILKRRNLVSNLITGFICAYIISVVKGYILLAFIPAAGYWIFSSYKDKIQSSFLRAAAAPLFLILGIGGSVVALSAVGSSLGKYSVDNLEKTALGYQTWHTTASEHGSGYSLGAVGDFSVGGMLTKFPLAINVTLFRPYPWEASSPFMFLAAIESLIMFFFTLNILWRTKLVRLPGTLLTDTNIVFCLTFAAILGFAVGFTSYNFGALVRYKIPVMPFYGVALILIDNVLKGGRKVMS
jgi:hypothetical protein